MTGIRYQSAGVRGKYANGSDIDLRLQDGTITLDESWSPYLQATITAVLPVLIPSFGELYSHNTDQNALDAFDPRAGKKATVDIELRLLDHDTPGTATDLGDLTTDLNIVTRSVDVGAGTMTLVLASDEYKLQTGGNDTASPVNYRAHQASLIAVVNQVLADAGLGATLDAVSVDADVTTTTQLTNLHPDPGVRSTTLGGWASASSSTTMGTPTGGGAVAPSQYVNATPSATTSNVVAYIVGPTASAISCQPGDVVTVSAYYDPQGSPRSGVTTIRFFDKNGATITDAADPAVSYPAAAWTRKIITKTAPAKAVSFTAFANFSQNGTTSPVALSCGMVTINQATETDGTTALKWFEGATAADAYYAYTWDSGVSGVAVASTSTRTPLVDRSPDSLVLSPGDSWWDMLEPVVTAAGRHLFCDEAGVWRLVDPDTYEVPGTLTVTSGTATSMIEQVDLSDAETDAATIVIHYTWTDRTGTAREAYDVAGEGGPIRTIELARPYPGQGLAAYILRKSHASGLAMDVRALTDPLARPYQGAVIAAPYVLLQSGVVSSIQINLAAGEMDVTTRGLLSLDPLAWLADTDTDWDSTPDGDWATV